MIAFNNRHGPWVKHAVELSLLFWENEEGESLLARLIDSHSVFVANDGPPLLHLPCVCVHKTIVKEPFCVRTSNNILGALSETYILSPSNSMLRILDAFFLLHLGSDLTSLTYYTNSILISSNKQSRATSHKKHHQPPPSPCLPRKQPHLPSLPPSTHPCPGAGPPLPTNGTHSPRPSSRSSPSCSRYPPSRYTASTTGENGPPRRHPRQVRPKNKSKTKTRPGSQTPTPSAATPGAPTN